MEASPHPPASVVERAVGLADAFRRAGPVVVAVRVGRRTDAADRLGGPVDHPVPAGPRPEGFPDLVPEIAERADVVVLKRQWGAFYGTDLDLHLCRREIRTVVLAGIAEDATSARPATTTVRRSPDPPSDPPSGLLLRGDRHLARE